MAKKSVIKTVSRNLRAIKSAKKKVSRASSAKQRASATKRKAATKQQKSTQSKRTYTLRDLPNVKGRTFTQLVNSVHSHDEELQSLIKPGEMWAFEIGSETNGWNRSWQVYDTLGLLADQLERYESAARFGNKSNKEGREWINAIKIIKVGKPLKKDEDEESHYHSTVDKYRQVKDKEVKVRKQHQTDVISSAAEYSVARGQKKVANKVDIIESLLNIAKETDSRIEEYAKRMAAMEKQLRKLSKPVKKSKKKVGTKNAKPTKRMPKKSTKKAGTKKVTSKQSHAKKKPATKKKATPAKKIVRTKKVVKKKAGKK